MNIKRGDIYWIEQSNYRPAVGSVQKPRRPGIVVSNNANNAFSNTIEIVYLTGKPKKEIPTHCAIVSTGTHSTALCEQIQTISIEQITQYIGRCTDEEMAEIDKCIAISLGLPEHTDRNSRIIGLERDLAEAQVREAMLQKMYDDLLTRVMKQ